MGKSTTSSKPSSLALDALEAAEVEWDTECPERVPDLGSTGWMVGPPSRLSRPSRPSRKSPTAAATAAAMAFRLTARCHRTPAAKHSSNTSAVTPAARAATGSSDTRPLDGRGSRPVVSGTGCPSESWQAQPGQVRLPSRHLKSSWPE